MIFDGDQYHGSISSRRARYSLDFRFLAKNVEIFSRLPNTAKANASRANSIMNEEIEGTNEGTYAGTNEGEGNSNTRSHSFGSSRTDTESNSRSRSNTIIDLT